MKVDRLDNLLIWNEGDQFNIRIWLVTEADVDDVTQAVRRHEEDEARDWIGMPPRRRLGPWNEF